MSAQANGSLTTEVRPFTETLDAWIRQAPVLAALRSAQAAAAAKLAGDPGLRSSFVALDPAVAGLPAPEGIGTLRVAVSRAGADTSIERHPNSVQILYVLDGPVETQVKTAQGWRIDRYGEGGSGTLEDRWHLVPQAVWHKSNAPGPGDCAVVALHSAREVADEYADGAQALNVARAPQAVLR